MNEYNREIPYGERVPVKRANKNSPVSLAKSFGSFAEKEQKKNVLSAQKKI